MLRFAILLLFVGSDPLTDALKTIDEKTLQTHEAYLASDELEGRAAGFPGNEKAVEYLVKEVKSYGLAPAGVDGFTQEFKFGKERKAKNVVAELEGSDPKLKTEYVVIGGHLDHVGRKGQDVRGQSPGGPEGDEIWNGADDNGSGTSAILSIARAFAQGKVRPKRSLLFCFWNAEEAGLLGSLYWTKFPTRPLHKVVYCLNVDMIGRNPQRPMDLEGVKNAEGDDLERILSAALDGEEVKYTKFPHYNEAMFRSDGVNFLWQGIPASMLFTSWHADYHRSGDHADKIAYPNLAKIARASFRILNDVANLEKGLRLNLETPLQGRPLGLRGETLEGAALADLKLGDGNGAAKIAWVDAAGVLGQAGIQVGDVVTGFGGRPLPVYRPLETIWVRVQRTAGEQPAEVEVLRGGEKKALQATWPKKQ